MNDSDRVYVPAPPPRPSEPAFRPVARPPRRPLIAVRPPSGCARAALVLAALAAVVVAVGLCLVVFGIPLLFSAGDGGRINLLIAGVDRREETDWAARTDTVMVLTVDPAAKAGGLLSVPRDLQLPIPGYGEDRINTANVYGYVQGYPGGGPALLEATIESNLGIPIDGYVMLDFRVFERIVDRLGGIDVDVPQALDDTRYPDPRPGDPYAFKTIHFDPGPQHMDGQRALEYARSRMSTSDFDRARRQQQILLAIRHKALSPAGILRLPAVAAAALAGIQTDLSPAELVALAGLAVQIRPSDLQQLVIEAPLVYDYVRPDGADVQLPNWDLLGPAIDEMFGPAESR